jgi:hypothetical protein
MEGDPVNYDSPGFRPADAGLPSMFGNGRDGAGTAPGSASDWPPGNVGHVSTGLPGVGSVVQLSGPVGRGSDVTPAGSAALITEPATGVRLDEYGTPPGGDGTSHVITPHHPDALRLDQ